MSEIGIRKVQTAGAFLLAAACALPVWAGPTSYICTITDFLGPPGMPIGTAEMAAETTLAIDRITGRVIHPILGNTSFPFIEVIDPGSDEWSFKVFARSAADGPHMHVWYYQVDEYETGLVKPFLAVGEGFAFVGSCE